jgi:hypothetical protein
MRIAHLKGQDDELGSTGFYGVPQGSTGFWFYRVLVLRGSGSTGFWFYGLAAWRRALESVHARLRRIIKTRGHFPTDDAATQLIWFALRKITATWERTAPTWRQAMNQFAILYGARFLPPTTCPRAWTLPSCGRTERVHSDLKTAQNAVSHSAHTLHPGVRR